MCIRDRTTIIIIMVAIINPDMVTTIIIIMVNIINPDMVTNRLCWLKIKKLNLHECVNFDFFCQS